MFLGKRGVSDVIATVLMIMLVIVAVGIVFGFVIPFVQNNLEGAGSCIEIFDAIDINRQYTCKGSLSGQIDSTTGNPILNNDVLVSVNVGDAEIDGLLIAVSDGGSRKSLEIKGENLEGIYMYEYNVNIFTQAILQVPGRNGGRTYRIVNSEAGFNDPSSVQVSPIVGNKVCDPLPVFNLQECQGV